MLMNVFVIVHDNGVKGQEGYSEHPIYEIWRKGGINNLLAEYRMHGIHVYRWFQGRV